MSEPQPSHMLGAFERTRYETRRDLRMGLGSSVIVHTALIFTVFTLAAALYVARDIPAAQPQQQDQIITIETLVREPQTTAQVRQPTRQQMTTHVAVAQHEKTSPAAGLPLERTTLAIRQQTSSRVQSADRGFSISLGRSGDHKSKPSKSSATRPELATASSSASQANAAGTNGPSQAAGSDDSQDDGGGYLVPGRGPVWSEHAPSGPFGGHGGHDNCTPSRGGFLLGH